MIHGYHDGLPDAVFSWDTFEMPSIKSILEKVPVALDYDQRSMVVAREGDTVIIRSRADPDWIRGLNARGFGPPPEQVITLNAGRSLAGHILEHREGIEDRIGDAEIFHPYFSSRNTVHAARSLGLGHFGPAPDLARRLDNKEVYKNTCRDLGIPVSPGTVIRRNTNPEKVVPEFARELRDAHGEFAHLSPLGQLFARGTDGSSGSSTYTVSEDDIYANALAMAEDAEQPGFIVEPKYRLVSSPSVIFRLDGDILRLAPVSGQLMSGKSHFLGNFYPTDVSTDLEREIIDYSLALAAHDLKTGYKGELGYDWMVTDDGQLFGAERNARVTGQSPLAATYGMMKERHGPLVAASFILHSDFRTYREVEERIGKDLYDGGMSGTLVVNFGPCSRSGDFGLQVFARDPDELKRLSLDLCDRIDPSVKPYLEEQLLPRAEEPLA